MKTRNTIIWLLVLISLGVFAYYYEGVYKTRRNEAEEAAQKVFLASLEEINQFQIIREDDSIQCIKNKQGDWQISDPLQTKADNAAVQALLTNVLNLKIQRVADEQAQDLEPYGLREPHLKLILKSSQNNYLLSLGKSNPTGDLTYARQGLKNKVFLIAANLVEHLDKDLYALRDKQIIYAPRTDVITSLRLTSPQNDILLVQSPDKGWQMLEPIKTKADDKAVNKLIYILDGIHAKRFVTEKPAGLARYGLDKPGLIVEITGKEKNAGRQTLLLGKKDETDREIYAKLQNKDDVFSFPAEAGDFLKKTVFDLRDKQLFSINQVDITKLELIHTDQYIILTRKLRDIHWKMQKPEKASTNFIVIAKMLNKLNTLKAEDIIEQPDTKTGYGFDNPVLRLNLYLKGADTPSHSLIIGAKQPKTGLSYAKADNKIVMLETKLLNELGKKALDFKADKPG